VFTINDVMARYQRMKGKVVLNPFGFDSFWLPTENYAMQQGKPAWQVTKENGEFFLKQLEALDMSFDQERLFFTSDPEYYKWTQWIFLKLYEAGLVYRAEKFVNRCPGCQTVLANDQVVDGLCERCKSEIIQKKHPQWFIKITDYADRLIADLDTIDWPEETKLAQRNWIGRSEWAEIDFAVCSPLVKEGLGEIWTKITCFTTRIDTVYGVTAVVLAPENTIIDDYLTPENKEKVLAYRKESMAKTAVQRQQDTKEKSGVKSGIFVIHPLTGQEIEIWFADYVLMDYGTGAVMFVPSHDERDREFAQVHGLPIIQVLEQTSWEESYDLTTWKSRYSAKDDSMQLCNSADYNGMTSQQAKKAITAHLESLWAWTTKITYRLRDWSVSRQRYWGSPIPMYYDENNTPHPIPESELPVVLPRDIENYKPKGKSPLEDHASFPMYKEWLRRECDTLDTFMCSSFYFLRFPDAHNPDELIRKELAEKMFPIDLYTGWKEHTVGHLLYSRFIHKFLYDQGYVSSPEPFAKLVHQGMILGSDGRKMGKRYGNVIDPLDVVASYGSDAVRTYLMFMGPVEQEKIRNDNALKWIKKFLDRIERACLGMKTMNVPDKSPPTTFGLWQEGSSTEKIQKSLESLTHKTIKGMTHDLEQMKYNTAVSKLMILLNAIEDAGSLVPREILEIYLHLLVPFAPKIAQDIWAKFLQTDDLTMRKRPSYDLAKVVDDEIIVPVQINGKRRLELTVPADADETVVMDAFRETEDFWKYIGEQTIKKVIYVKGKILNVVV
jgi:leucyl-tRNA synthetase